MAIRIFWQTAPADSSCSHTGILICSRVAAPALFLHLLVALAFGFHHLGQDVAGAAAALALDDQEAPGKQLAVVRRPRARLQNVGQLLFGGAGLRHRLGRAGAAAEQQIQRVWRRVVEIAMLLIVGHRGLGRGGGNTHLKG